MIFILIIAAIFLTDEKIKQHIERTKEMHAQKPILKNKIIIERYHNTGAILNFLDQKSYIVKYISAAMLGILFIIYLFLLRKKDQKVLSLAIAFILGGGLSNVYDRIKKGYVVDYFSINYKKLKNIIFNISDMFIMVGSLLAGILSFFKYTSKFN